MQQRYLSFEGKKEITSRIPSWEIAQVLEKLAISYDKNKEKQGCYDVVIATNMIAVGMDVDRLNNYVHANGIRYVMDNYIYQDKKENKDKELIETLQNITDIFLSLLTVIDSIKFHSSDYLDALEMGMKPQEGSQYWVCPIIVEYMNERFDKKLLQYIQNNEGNGMQFIAEYYAE